MPFMHETTYDVNAGQFDAFKAWLRANEEALADAYPDGAQYVGTFASVFGDENNGAYKSVVRLKSYAILDDIANEVASEGALGRLLWELSAFTVGGPSSRGRQELWKRASHKVPTRH